MSQVRYSPTQEKEDYEKGNSLYMACQYRKSFVDFARAVTKGHPAACLKIAVMLFEGKPGIQQDQQHANKYFEQLKLPVSFCWFSDEATKKTADAQFNFGLYYAYVLKDMPKAVALYQLAANQNHAEAQLRLGECCESGEGITQNIAAAAKWYQSSAALGYPQAQLYLGLCYCDGLAGLQKDQELGIKNIILAANKEHPTAQYFLSDKYANGKGVPLNRLRALEYCQLAAAQGHEMAQIDLHVYEYNVGLEYQNANDLKMAVKYYQIAAEKGHGDAATNLEMICRQYPQLRPQTPGAYAPVLTGNSTQQDVTVTLAKAPEDGACRLF